MTLIIVRPTGGKLAMPSVSYPNIVKDGLVLNLDAGASTSYSGSGTTWNDMSGRGNNGTLTNGPTYSSANGGSIVFDGSNDYTTLSSSQLAPGTGAFTWNFWIKLNDLSNFSIIFSGTGSNSGYGVVYANPSSGGLGYYANANLIADNNTAFGSSWWYVTFTGNGGANGSRNLKLYRNGVQAGSTYTVDYNFTSSTPNIGANHSSYAELMRGNISNVTYYNRALSAAEILQNFYAMVPRYYPIVTSGLVLNLDATNPASYPGSGTTWTDISGSGNNATISNGSYDSANGGSIAFNGTTTGVYYTTIANSGDFTCEIWAKQTSANYGSAMMFGGSNYFSGPDNCQLVVNGGDGSIGLALNNAGISVSPANASSATSVNNWYQVIWSRSGSTINIYANGVFKSSGTSSAQLRIDRLGNVGGAGGSLGKWLLGNISSAKVYNRALSATEVTQNFNALRYRYGI